MTSTRPTEYKTRFFQPADRQGVIALIREVFGSNAASTLERTWDWKYETWEWVYADHPEIRPPGTLSLVVTHNADVVAFFGQITTRIKIHDRVFPSIWSVDYAAHPAHRGRGIKLMKMVMQDDRLRRYIKLGTPRPRARELSLRLGNWHVTQLLNYKHLLNPSAVFTAKSGSGLWQRLGSYPFSIAYKAARLGVSTLQRPSKHDRIAMYTDIAFDERFDDLWLRVSPDYDALTVRDSAYLNWRFNQCPVHDYITLTAERDDRLSGYLVFNIQDREPLRYCHIVDFLVDKKEPGVLDRLLAWAIDYAKGRGADIVHCSVAPNQTMCRKVLRRNGFLVRKQGLKIIQGPAQDAVRLSPDMDCYFTRSDGDSDYS